MTPLPGAPRIEEPFEKPVSYHWEHYVALEQEARRIKNKAREEMDAITRKVGAVYGISRAHIGGWECPNEPLTGHCVYDHDKDPWHDWCIICEEPSERK